MAFKNASRFRMGQHFRVSAGKKNRGPGSVQRDPRTIAEGLRRRGVEWPLEDVVVMVRAKLKRGIRTEDAVEQVHNAWLASRAPLKVRIEYPASLPSAPPASPDASAASKPTRRRK